MNPNTPSNQITQARQKYEPTTIKYLLIAESPPDDPERFFYYEDVKEHDHLFLGVMEALYPAQKEAYLKSRRSDSLKKDLLKQFQTDGFFLLDLLDIPIKSYIKIHGDSYAKPVNNMVQRLQSMITLKTPIILIKENVYEILAQSLRKARFNVVNKDPIFFPAQGQQRKFQSSFQQALKAIGFPKK